MIAALATLKEPSSLIICNGYKDKAFIILGLQVIKPGIQCFFVIETPTELPIIIEQSKRLSIAPNIGVRIKMSTRVSGHWNHTSGERSVFGLSSTQLIDVVDTLKQENMLDCLTLLHCHLGSQIPNIQDIRQGVAEACRFYIDLTKEGATLNYIDLGGGLAVDYSGAEQNNNASRNYTLIEYCEDIVDTLKQNFDRASLAHPTIITESGRAIVAYSSVLLFNILDTNTFSPSSLPEADNSKASDENETGEHPIPTSLRDIHSDINVKRLQENNNDANYYRSTAEMQ